MTYEELYRSLTKKERFVNNQLLDRMQVDDEGSWSKCLRNKILYRLAYMILGYDPCDFVYDNGVKLEIEPADLELLKNELDDLRKAFN